MDEQKMIYFLKKTVGTPDVSYRITPLHQEVFHGQGYYPMASRSLEEFAPIPGVTNSYREHLHITRSGVFVPQMFKAGWSLVVSQEIYNRIKGIDGIIGEQVIFEKLVDLPMPRIGDMSWYGASRKYAEPNPKHEYSYLEDVPELHRRVGVYYEILRAIPGDFRMRGREIRVETSFGRYHDRERPRMVDVYVDHITRYPFIGSSVWTIRQDLFQELAPYIDLDYFAIDAIDQSTITISR